MAVENYIHDLLYRFECVVLPGFGAFITQQHSAKLDTSTDQFHPPKKCISFNRQLITNDGLLATHIVEVENISYETALHRLEAFVQDLNTVLDKNKTIHLNKIGSFYITEGEKLQFEPVESNYLKEAFGLSKFTSKEILHEAFTEQVDPVEEKAPVHFLPEKRAANRVLRYAAIGLLTVGLSGVAGLNIYSHQIDEHNLAQQEEAASKLEDQIQKATFKIDNPLPAVTLKVFKQTGKYHVVAGAFRMVENAEKRVQQLKAAGYKARQIGANRFGLHQVLYSSHERRSEALKALRQVKKNNPQAWLLVQEL